MSETSFRYPLWTRGDLDGFFGLMIDNLVQVLLIIGLCTAPTVAGLPPDLVHRRILPGIAVSLLLGNLFYGLQAHWVARRDRNAACTALPYGINTPTVFAFALFIMAPVYRSALHNGTSPQAAADLAWKAGLLACLVSGIIELLGAFLAERLRRVTPRAALLGVLAAIGVTFIASDFAFRIYTTPLVGLLPLMVLLLAYFAHWRFPLGLPGGFVAILLGTAIAWGVSAWQAASGEPAPLRSLHQVRDGFQSLGWVAPRFAGPELLVVLARPDLLLLFLTVSVPMGLVNVLGSLQNIESAEAGGDRFHTASSLAVNGLGSIAAALFGSCFPTTIYIGHPGWKALGARAGYSILNGLFFTACFLLGLGPLLVALIPIEAGAAIVVYIGILIAAQAFQATPREHAPAIALGLFPALAAMVTFSIPPVLSDARTRLTLADMLATSTGQAALPVLPGLVTLTGANSAWFIVTLILIALGVALIERRYAAAALWSAAGALLTAAGLLHAHRVEGNLIRELFIWQPAPTPPAVAQRALPIAAGYAAAAGLFALAAWRETRRPMPPRAATLPADRVQHTVQASGRVS